MAGKRVKMERREGRKLCLPGTCVKKRKPARKHRCINGSLSQWVKNKLSVRSEAIWGYSEGLLASQTWQEQRKGILCSGNLPRVDVWQ